MATIYYWAMQGTSVGHLSIGLEGGTYISHWPDERYKRNPILKVGGNKQRLEDDIEAEERFYDEAFVLPAEMVDFSKIQEWWNSLKSTYYHLIFSNCAQMVYKALNEGGITAERYGIDLALMGGTQITPLGVLNWVKLCYEKFKSNPHLGYRVLYVEREREREKEVETLPNYNFMPASVPEKTIAETIFEPIQNVTNAVSNFLGNLFSSKEEKVHLYA